MKPEIQEAFNKWDKAENKVPEKEYDPKYKSRSATARKHWKVFSNLCKAENLNPVEVAHSLNGCKTITLTVK